MSMLATEDSSLLEGELRESTLEAAKRHKASWLDFGRHLHAVFKDNYFRDWGYMSFDTYCVKELGIKRTTAIKLLKSYRFIEDEEPEMVRKEQAGEIQEAKIPNYETVNLLRLAKSNKELDEDDYKEIRESVITKASEPKEVRAQVKRLLIQKKDEGKAPDEIRREHRNGKIRRLVGMLYSAKRDFESESTVPQYLIKELITLTEKLEDQLE